MHPMYRAPTAGANLCQGDIISSEHLTRIGALAGHMDYIASRKDFKAFCILTQTCDLVPGQCADFITLAVVRIMTNVFSKEAVASQRGKDRVANILRGVLEHRQNSRDYFYLYPELSAGLEEDSVVDLRVMFALHNKHYSQISEARRMSMHELYAANLGWMTGNIFSRIAMPVWSQLQLGEQKDDRIKALLEGIATRGIDDPSSIEVPMRRRDDDE
jgi:hypothetical protein